MQGKKQKAKRAGKGQGKGKGKRRQKQSVAVQRQGKASKQGVGQQGKAQAYVSHKARGYKAKGKRAARGGAKCKSV